MKHTVRKKLILSYFLLVLLMAAMAFLSVQILSRLQNDSEIILRDHQPALADAAAIVNDALFHSLKVDQYVATGNKAHLRAIGRLEESVETHLVGFENRTQNEKDHALIREIREAFATYIYCSFEGTEKY